MADAVRLLILPSGRTARLAKGEPLIEGLLKAGFPVHSACGSTGACGKCLVRIEGEASPLTESEIRHLGESELARGVRLACQVRLQGDARVEILSWEPIACAGEEAGRMAAGCELAAAVDIGTTTIKMELLSLPGGETLARRSSLNSQRVFGHDVMSRIQAARDPERFAALVRLVRESVREMMESALDRVGATPSRVVRIVLSGNTVMLHCFFGLEITGMGKYPYQPATLEAVTRPARELGFHLFCDAVMTGFPAISAYLGGDLVSGLLATGLGSQGKTSLLIDIGTNSEIILVHPQGISATSCAAGPALEGMSIRCGMTASPGAIEGVRIAETLALQVIPGSARPLGLCGSGIIDLVAELLRVGLVDTGGKMANGGSPARLRQKVCELNGTRAFRLTDEVFFTQKDLRQVQLAKGAILSGLGALMSASGVSPEAIESVVIAGEFGRHLKLENLFRLGILERFPNAAYAFIGNSSLSGARRLAIDPSLLDEAVELAGRVAAFPLSTCDGYEKRFVQALEFPASLSTVNPDME